MPVLTPILKISVYNLYSFVISQGGSETFVHMQNRLYGFSC